ncbi:MAG: nucleotidyl transferase AbiEii/AbiGii toxin family protein [Phycisphaerae bacterium]
MMGRRRAWPETYRKDVEVGGDERAKIFDPALRQFGHGFRRGEPVFGDTAELEAWRGARRRVIGCLLGVIAGSGDREHLVLRGSTLLKAMIGEAAREPGDVDWVVTPNTILMTSAWGKELFAALRKMVGARKVEGVEIDAEGAATDEIWTYDRCPGRRIVFPWRAAGLPGGTVQMDFVFGEQLWALPEERAIEMGGERVVLRAASAELSLAWKLMWLETDIAPQGKDLYDAVVLAERTGLRKELLLKAMSVAVGREVKELPRDFPMKWNVDWGEFEKEMGGRVAGNARAYQERLTQALAGTFGEREGARTFKTTEDAEGTERI